MCATCKNVLSIQQYPALTITPPRTHFPSHFLHPSRSLHRPPKNMPPSRDSPRQMNCLQLHLLLFLSLLHVPFGGASSPPPPVVPFPLPTHLRRGNTILHLSPWMFQLLDLSDTPTRTLRLAMERCKALLFPHHHGQKAPSTTTASSSYPYHSLAALHITVHDSSEAPPQLETDESYVLSIPLPRSDVMPAIGTLKAQTVYGALHGLESFAQLISFNYDESFGSKGEETEEEEQEAFANLENEEEAKEEELNMERGKRASFPLLAIARRQRRRRHLSTTTSSSHQSSSPYVLPNAPLLLQDSPRFPWRGVMIDTRRHFLSLPHLYRLLNSMAAAKLNVLHWHLVDSPSFSLQSFLYPKLWQTSFSKGERYLQSDVAAIVEYARLRGIRVMAELDVPGHAASWCEGGREGDRSICPSPQCLEPLDPSQEATFELLEGLLQELTGGKEGEREGGLFPFEFFHLGGDEVDPRCWSETPRVVEWMQAQGENFTVHEAYKYFVDKASGLALAAGRAPVQWVEVFESFGATLHPATVVHIWKEKSTMLPVLEAGYRALLSNTNVWYLDHLGVTYNIAPLYIHRMA